MAAATRGDGGEGDEAVGRGVRKRENVGDRRERIIFNCLDIPIDIMHL